MGLFDGIDGATEAGSTAEIAKLLAAPVILVVDAGRQARSAAALVHGFAGFDPGLKLGGVIFNNVASGNHQSVLREAMSAALPDMPLLGCMPRDPELAIPSRHLGLLTAEENPLSEEFLDHLCAVIDRHLDLDAILTLAGIAPHAPVPLVAVGDAGRIILEVVPPSTHLGGEGRAQGGAVSVGPAKIAVARDAAFCFVYQDNLRLLRESGAELCYFSPLGESALPEGVSGIYLPGGYPELFAQRLAGNELLKEGIRLAVEEGMPVYAECGGFIYLTEGVAIDHAKHSFVGIFPVSTRMLPRRRALGYRQVELLVESVIGGKGTLARGHEFHYSEMEEMPPSVVRLYGVSRKNVSLGQEGYSYKNCLASYIHLHFGSSHGIADSFVAQCRAYMTRSLTSMPPSK
jgi:cobyrinic acid a,c-diamide synthase